MSLSNCTIWYTKINTKFPQRLKKHLVKYSLAEQKSRPSRWLQRVTCTPKRVISEIQVKNCIVMNWRTTWNPPFQFEDLTQKWCSLLWRIEISRSSWQNCQLCNNKPLTNKWDLPWIPGAMRNTVCVVICWSTYEMVHFYCRFPGDVLMLPCDSCLLKPNQTNNKKKAVLVRNEKCGSDLFRPHKYEEHLG